MEKRSKKRKRLIYYLSVFDRNTDEFIGQLVDITTEGMMLTCEAPVKENTLFQIRMVLPEIIEGSKYVMFDAMSLWNKKDVNPNFHLIGFKFTNISQRAVNVIESLIYEFSFTG